MEFEVISGGTRVDVIDQCKAEESLAFFPSSFSLLPFSTFFSLHKSVGLHK